MPQKTGNPDNTTAYVTLVVGLISAGAVILVSGFPDTTKAICGIALAFVAYAVHNEIDKRKRSKSH